MAQNEVTTTAFDLFDNLSMLKYIQVVLLGLNVAPRCLSHTPQKVWLSSIVMSTPTDPALKVSKTNAGKQ